VNSLLQHCAFLVVYSRHLGPLDFVGDWGCHARLIFVAIIERGLQVWCSLVSNRPAGGMYSRCGAP
jgi:hypothetical protein